MGSENSCGFELEKSLVAEQSDTGCVILKDSVRSHACCVVVMLEQGHHSHISIIWGLWARPPVLSLALTRVKCGAEKVELGCRTNPHANWS